VKYTNIHKYIYTGFTLESRNKNSGLFQVFSGPDIANNQQLLLHCFGPPPMNLTDWCSQKVFDWALATIFYLDSVRPIRTADFEAVDWATGFANKHGCIVGLLKETGSFFTARRLAKRGICHCRVSVCLSHSGIVSKRLNVGSRKQRRTIAP